MSDFPLFFQIGFKRCGTSAIACFFNRSGIPAVHHDCGRLALRLRENLAAGRPPLSGYEQYRAFTNMDYIAEHDFYDGFKQHPALLEYYGDRARFILNTRPFEHWISSLSAHYGDRPAGMMRAYYEYRYETTDPDALETHWRTEWVEHHDRVMREIPTEQLLVFDIESDPPEKLCEFSGLPPSCARFYRPQNPSLSRVGRLIANCVPLPVRQVLPATLHLPLKNLLRARK